MSDKALRPLKKTRKRDIALIVVLIACALGALAIGGWRMLARNVSPARSEARP